MALERKLEQLELEMSSGQWYPRTSSGKQITPNALRGRIMRFLAESGMTQTEFLQRAGINPGSYSRFKKPSNYKNQWSACSNQSYWNAAVFLAREAIHKKIRARDAKKAAKADAKKRKRDDKNGASFSSSAAAASAAPLSKKQKKAQVEALVQQILAVPGVDVDDPIYDNCDIIRAKVQRFLIKHDFRITPLLRALDLNSGSWAKFNKFTGKGAGAANICYPVFYKFFEQKRLLEKKPKSKARKEAELNFGHAGYRRRHDDGTRWTLRGAPVNPDIFDIDKMAAMRRQYP